MLQIALVEATSQIQRRRIPFKELSHLHQALLLSALLVLTAGDAEYPITPYVDPAQLDCPWPQMSHYKQP